MRQLHLSIPSMEHIFPQVSLPKTRHSIDPTSNLPDPIIVQPNLLATTDALVDVTKATVDVTATTMDANEESIKNGIEEVIPLWSCSTIGYHYGCS